MKQIVAFLFIIIIQMLQPNFQKNSIKKSLVATHEHNPKLRVSYSGGFRKFSPNSTIQGKKNQLTLSKSRFTQKQNQIINYVDQLGIQNLTKYYEQTIEDTSKLLFQKFKNDQQQSVVRLYKNLYPTRRSKAQQDDSKTEQSKQTKRYASEVWSIDKKYEKQPPEFILRKEVEKVHKKYVIQLRGMLSRKKISENQLCYCQFQEVFSCFLIEQYQNIFKIKKIDEKSDLQMQVFFIWKKFLCTVNFKYLLRKYQNKKITIQLLQKLKNTTKYLYCIIVTPIKKQNQSQIQQINYKFLCSLINIQPVIPSIQQLKTKFQIDKQYTNPYLIQYMNIQSNKKKKISEENMEEKEQMKKFKAAPIPKSTYTYTQKNKPQVNTTVIDPFNLTEKGVILTPQQYYIQQKKFKAQPVPISNSKPFKPNLLSKQQIKARAAMKLEKAKYPTTMQQLNRYNQYQKQKGQVLMKKHVKDYYQQYHPHQIPNFNHLHAQQIVTFQNLKQKNKKNTQAKPFNLSVGKPKQKIQQNNYIGSPIIHPYSPPKQQKPSKSTKKFDAYVKFRNDKQMKREQKKQQEEKQKEKKQKTKKPYVAIIKQKMRQQFQAHPKSKSNYDASLPQKIKVDKQKIYYQTPLLMKSSLPPQDVELDWEPIF